MIRAVLSTFLFVAILGLGCMGVAVPGKADELKQKPWAGYKTKLTDTNWELTIRYSDSGEKYFAVVEKDGDRGRCEGAVDKLGNLQGADCTPDCCSYCLRWLVGHVTRIELQNSGGSAGGAEFVDKKLAQRIKAEPDR